MARTRNLLFVSLALAGLMFGVSDSAQAAFITGGPFNGTDVGAVDTLMGQLDSSHPCIAAGGSIITGGPFNGTDVGAVDTLMGPSLTAPTPVLPQVDRSMVAIQALRSAGLNHSEGSQP